jgi:integrase
MATLKIRHLVIKPGKAGSTRCFWQPSAKLRALGWTGFALKDTDGNFLGLPAAMAAAEAQNARLDAWRQGEDTPGTPGQPVAAGSVQALIDAYTASPRFTGLAADTRKGYLVLLKVIAQWAGDAPMAAITRQRVQALYQQLYRRTPSRANHLVTMIRTLYAFGVDNFSEITINPAEKPKLMGTGARAAVWSDRAMDALMDTALGLGRPSVAVGVMMAAHLAQRPTDVRLMLRSSYNQGRFTFHQSKTGELIQVRALPELAAALDAYLPTHNHATILVNEATGLPYTENAWSHAFRHTRAKAMELHPDAAELARLQFRDFRRTGVVRLAEAGATVPEVAAVSGHSIDATSRIMETYLPRTTKMADQAIAKLETARANRAKAKGE